MKNETKTEATVMPIQTKHLAVKFGMKATTLRRVLRSMPEYADGVHTNYRWAENDKRIDAIARQINKLAQDKAKRAETAKAALAARVEATKKQQAADAKAGVATA